MRSIVFRILAGLLATAVGWFLLTADLSKHSLTAQVGFWVIGIAFAVSALFGEASAVKWLGLWFGIGHDVAPPPVTSGDVKDRKPT